MKISEKGYRNRILWGCDMTENLEGASPLPLGNRSSHTTGSTRSLLAAWLNSWQFTNQSASFDLLILPLLFFPLCARTHLIRDFFLMLFRLSGTVSLAKIDYQTHSSLLNHLWNVTSSCYPIDCACMCACVRACMCACVGACVRVCVCVCVCSWKFDCVLVLCFVTRYGLQFGEMAHKRVHHY